MHWENLGKLLILVQKCETAGNAKYDAVSKVGHTNPAKVKLLGELEDQPIHPFMVWPYGFD